MPAGRLACLLLLGLPMTLVRIHFAAKASGAWDMVSNGAPSCRKMVCMPFVSLLSCGMIVGRLASKRALASLQMAGSSGYPAMRASSCLSI